MGALRVAIVAGETSGDALGGALIGSLRERVPDARFLGVAGAAMRAAGCEPLADAHELAVMGLTEVLTHLPRLLRLRARLLRQILAWRPDVFIGIDYQQFNLGLARRLKGRGFATVQYVSPQVWAWRAGRVTTMAQAYDLVLCLLPFEPAFYAAHAVRARFVGHPLADQIPVVLGLSEGCSEHEGESEREQCRRGAPASSGGARHDQSRGGMVRRACDCRAKPSEALRL